jgi:hypothetical protein
MPPVSEQLGLQESLTHPEFAGARFLLKPGRKYHEAVDLFSPYGEVKDAYLEARASRRPYQPGRVEAGHP